MSVRSARDEDEAGPSQHHLYNDEAAQSVFFNAPKVTVRNNRKGKARFKETDDEDEQDHETYDENADKELNEKIAQHLKDFFAKKITAKNAFETPILDKLHTVAEMEPLQCVGAMLDASARVYAFRVDNTHCECFSVRTNFDEAKKKKERENANDLENDSADEGGVDVEDGDSDGDKGAGNADAEGDDGGEASAKGGSITVEKTKKKKGFKGMHNAELGGRLDDLYKKSVKLVSRFVRHTLPTVEQPAQAAEPVNELALLENFENYGSMMQDIVVSRRVGVPFIEQKMLGLNRTVEEFSIDDPIYHKVAKQFEEGCAQSFVNNEVLTNRDGSFLILHTNWRENEPFTQSNAAGPLSTSRLPNVALLESIEASLARALAPVPNNLQLLQEFCEEEEDQNKEAMSEKDASGGVRLLGRKSQDVARASDSVTIVSPLVKAAVDKDSTANYHQHDATEEQEMDGSTSSLSLSDEEKTCRENEELAKFQMYLDEDSDIKPNIVRDSFENLNYFPDGFANAFLGQDSVNDKADADKAVFHHLTDADASYFGISPSLMLEIKAELKPKRRISEELLRKLMSQIEPGKIEQFNRLLKSESLVMESPPEDALTAAPVSYLVTRFAPLIDSIWHAVIKAADEENLAKADVFVGGVKNAQRALNRQLHHQAHLASKRRKPHLTQTPSQRTDSTITPVRSTRRGTAAKHSQQTSTEVGVSPPKRQRVGLDDDEFSASQFSEFDEPNTPVSNRPSRERIYFWARPRQYPIVYLGQVLCERDNPMQQQGVEMFVDMEEMLLGLDEANKSSQEDADDSDVVSLGSATIESTNVESQPSTRPSNANEMEEEESTSANDGLPKEIKLENNLNDDDFGASADDNDFAGTFEDIFRESPLAAVDYLDGDIREAIEDALNVEPIVLEQQGDADNEPIADDLSHWKGAVVNDAYGHIEPVMEEVVSKEKKTKKKAPGKPKRRRMSSDVNAEMGGSLTEEMSWQSMADVEQDIIKSIIRHQTNVTKREDLIYRIENRRLSTDPKLFLEKKDFTVDFSGQYDPLQLIKTGLFYESHKGFWRFERKEEIAKVVFYSRSYKYETPSLDEQSNDFLSYYFRDRLPLKADLCGATNEDIDHYTNFNPYELNNGAHDFDDSGGFNDSGELGGLACLNDDVGRGDDVDIKIIAAQSSELKMEEQLEFNGGIIKIHQSRVKAPLVKRAIATILSTKELDLKNLNNMRAYYSTMRRASRTHANSDKENQADEGSSGFCEPMGAVHNDQSSGDDAQSDVSIDDENDEEANDVSSSSPSSSEDEEDEMNRTNPNVGGVPTANNITTREGSFSVQGEHTFESLLANLPQHLSGRTKCDLNVINAFAITLHMCNENQMRLMQDKDEDTLLVKPKAMSSFKFHLSEN